MVDIMADRIAAKSIPPTHGLNRSRIIKIKTFSLSPPVTSGNIGIAIRPTNTAKESEKATQIIAITADLGISFTDLMLIKRERIWGCPKYPNPHAAAEIIASRGIGPAGIIEVEIFDSIM